MPVTNLKGSVGPTGPTGPTGSTGPGELTELTDGASGGVDVTDLTDLEISFEAVASANNVRVLKFPFTYDTPNLLTGATVYVPTVGDILLDAWLEIDAAWDGTTPLGDVGNFAAETHTGWFSTVSPTSTSLDMTQVDAQNLNGSGHGPLIGQTLSDLLAWNPINVSNAPASGYRAVPAKFADADPIKVVVSQDGSNTGADPGSTQGAAILYLVVATPETGGAVAAAELLRAVYDNSSAASAVAYGVRTALDFGTLGTGDALFDLTDPTAPTIVADGVYAITAVVNFAEAGVTAGSLIIVEMEFDPDGLDIDACNYFVVNASGGGFYGSVSNTWFLAVGTPISVTARHFDAIAHTFGINATIQQVR
jgi:hypothetical protein